MKILIATGIYPPDIGGPATYSKSIVEEFSKLGHEIKVVAFSDTRKKSGINIGQTDLCEYDVIRILRGQNIFLRYIKYFWQILKNSRDVDWVYVQGPVSAGLPAAIACLINGKKFVLKVVGDVAWERARGKDKTPDDIDEFQNKKHNKKTERIKKAQRWVCKRASKIIVPSNYLKKIVTGWGIKPEKIKVVYNALSASPDNTSQVGAKCKSNLRAERIVLSVGRLVPWKGFDALLETIKELPEDVVLKIVGDGPERERLEERRKSLGVQNKVEFLGKLSHGKLLQLMAQATVFVLNTKYEGLPHIILESLSVGLPVITTNIGGNPEVIKNNWNGILINPDNRKEIKEAILKILDDKNLAENLAKNGKDSLKKFSVDRMIKETLKELI